MRDYRKIDAWKLADELTMAVYEQTRAFPREETYGLTSQIRRSAYSVPSNIAEGSARNTKKDYLSFLYIARGSLTETQYFVHLSHRLGYLPDSAKTQLMDLIRQAARPHHGGRIRGCPVGSVVSGPLSVVEIPAKKVNL